MSDECTWPEQDAIDKWWKKHQMELKTAVTEYRITRDEPDIEAYENKITEQADALEAKTAWAASETRRAELLERDNERFRAALRFIDDEAHDLNAAEECAREALAAVEVDPCAKGHDFVGKGTAICADCGERADVSETGAARTRRGDL